MPRRNNKGYKGSAEMMAHSSLCRALAKDTLAKAIVSFRKKSWLIDCIVVKSKALIDLNRTI
jgi:hypothetical protein